MLKSTTRIIQLSLFLPSVLFIFFFVKINIRQIFFYSSSDQFWSNENQMFTNDQFL